MESTQDNISEVRLNPKYEPIPGEFLYKNSYWCSWSSTYIIKKLETEFKFFPDDVLVATYPKGGTTLLQEILYLIMNDVDLEKSKSHPIYMRCPFLDENFEMDFTRFNYKGLIVDGGDHIPRPRFMKTHLQYQNLKDQFDKNPEMKVVIVLRNPKDNAVSMFHFYRGITDYGPFKGTWNEFFERWVDGWISGGDWLDVTLGWWNARHRKNFKIIFFEDMVLRKRQVIKELCEFFGKTLSEEQMDTIILYTEFKNAKANPNLNYSLMNFEWSAGAHFEFMRKGEVGDWKNYFTDEQNRIFDQKYSAALERVGLHFQFE